MHLDKVKAKTALLVSGKTHALGVSVESLMEQ